jgi:hypothetical protein
MMEISDPRAGAVEEGGEAGIARRQARTYLISW